MKKEIMNVTTKNLIFEINQIIDKISPEDKAVVIPKITKYVGESLIKDFFREFFEQNSNVKNFSWPQYTPSWNDGDVCRFEVNIDSYSIEINGVSGDKVKEFKSDYPEKDIVLLEKELNEFNLKIEEYKSKSDTVSIILTKELLKNKKAIEDKIEKARKYSINFKLFSEIEIILEKSGIENIAEQCFGTNVRVICNSDGTITTDEYDCGY